MSIANVDVLLPAAPRKPARDKGAWWQRLFLLVGVVGLVLLVRSLPKADWPALLGHVGPALPVTVAVALGWIALYSRQFHVILEGAVGWGRLIYNRVVGDAYNVIIPVGDLGGDPVRLVDLSKQIDTATAVRGMVVERLVAVTGG